MPLVYGSVWRACHNLRLCFQCIEPYRKRTEAPDVSRHCPPGPKINTSQLVVCMVVLD